MPRYSFQELVPGSPGPAAPFKEHPAPLPPFPLRPGVVHLWLVHWDPDADARAFESCLELLTPAERERVARLRLEEPRWAAALGRGTLRLLLGRYLDLTPARLDLEITGKGKPYLPDPVNPPGLSFNLSHSGRYILLGVTRHFALGVDIESLKCRRLLRDVAERYFHPHELADLNAPDEAQNAERFYEYWTLKEAWIKAHGSGLSYPLPTLDFSRHRRLPQGASIRAEGHRWWCAGLTTPTGTKAAYACQI